MKFNSQQENQKRYKITNDCLEKYQFGILNEIFEIGKLVFSILVLLAAILKFVPKNFRNMTSAPDSSKF